MEFKKESLKLMISAVLLGLFLFGVIMWEITSKNNLSAEDKVETASPLQEQSAQEIALKPIVPNVQVLSVLDKENDAAIQKQLDRDREEQKQTKYLRTKLEQTNLELEEEKDLAEINKLKIENRGAFKEPTIDGQDNLPEVKVDYIGGDSLKKEAIITISGSSYQVREKSSPQDNIKVMSISDTGVTLHFSAPQDLTKTIEYKPE